jgi:hypothetical protein
LGPVGGVVLFGATGVVIDFGPVGGAAASGLVGIVEVGPPGGRVDFESVCSVALANSSGESGARTELERLRRVAILETPARKFAAGAPVPLVEPAVVSFGPVGGSLVAFWRFSSEPERAGVGPSDTGMDGVGVKLAFRQEEGSGVGFEGWGGGNNGRQEGSTD